MSARNDILRRLRTGTPPASPSAPPRPRRYADLETGPPANPLETFIRIFTENHGTVRRFATPQHLLDAWLALRADLPTPFFGEALPFPLDGVAAPQSTDDVHRTGTAFTGCRALVAQTGSILITAAEDPWRALSVYAPVHIVLATPQQLTSTLDDAFALLHGDESSFFTLIGGPSRTADIEKTLVLGAHGPRQVEVWVVESS